MGALPNRFSWSFSAAEDFDICRRRRFWSNYANWGGGDPGADAMARTAYRLDRMENRHALRGRAVEEAVRWILREHQAGRDPEAEEAYQRVARPLLNQCWKASRQQQWRDDPKRFCCLHEHYYPGLQSTDPAIWVPQVIDAAKRCLANFIRHVLPRLVSVTPEQEVPVATGARGGDLESFELHGVKVYAIPDYAYRRGDMLCIHDWKSGAPRPGHLRQLSIYGLWAHLKHGVPPERIEVFAEYLGDGTTHRQVLSADRLRAVTEAIGESVADMSAYLVNEDRSANRPLPQELWELTVDRGACRRCRFYELCAPELGAE